MLLTMRIDSAVLAAQLILVGEADVLGEELEGQIDSAAAGASLYHRGRLLVMEINKSGKSSFLHIDGYIYYKHSNRRNTTRYWRCQKVDSCRARATTTGDGESLTLKTGGLSQDHPTHAPNREAVAALNPLYQCHERKRHNNVIYFTCIGLPALSLSSKNYDYLKKVISESGSLPRLKIKLIILSVIVTQGCPLTSSCNNDRKDFCPPAPNVLHLYATRSRVLTRSECVIVAPRHRPHAPASIPLYRSSTLARKPRAKYDAGVSIVREPRLRSYVERDKRETSIRTADILSLTSPERTSSSSSDGYAQ
ncbi:unnamed protein product [Trichogramma brassicae]|uniref:FLYWCH-type domain-containing protein n=1 Tax=Trichogramma brassicae TaxID=86971 RepID=A0A6H5I929_9HYME|nr:unnamed protein product [Trichogramma brassicae]